MDLEIVVRKETGEIAEVALVGRVDMQTTELLKGRLTAVIEEGCRHILLNMRRVKFIDSVGLGSLIGARRRVVEAGVAACAWYTSARPSPRPWR